MSQLQNSLGDEKIQLRPVQLKRLFVGCILIVLFWSGIATVFSIFEYKANEMLGLFSPNVRRSVLFGFLGLAPFTILNCVFFFLFEIKPAQFLTIRSLVLLFGFLIAIVIPMNYYYSINLHAYIFDEQVANNAIHQEIWRAYFQFTMLWYNALTITFATSAQIAISFMRKRQRQQLTAGIIEREILEMKLKRLQTELAPPFLLNALEDVTALVMAVDQLEAMDALVHLSDVLRYILDSNQENELSVSDELQFLQNYVNLQGLRHGERLLLQLDVGHEDWTQYVVPPLIVFPIVELVVQKIQAQASLAPTTIRIACSRVQNHLHWTVTYSHDAVLYQANSEVLQPLRERLSLLFAGDATLQELAPITSAENRDKNRFTVGFSLTLPIDLMSDA